MEDKLDKKTIIINGSNISDITVNIEPIKNVCSIKLIDIYATRDTSTDLDKIFLCINDYGLKTLYDNSNYKSGINVFNNIIFYPSFTKNELNGTGIISDFNLDTQNFVFNPIQGELNRLNISFKKYNNTSELIDYTLKDFSLELCIYSKRMKLTMF
tara:strand:- start:7645 stop:8112 length:468 start_codon:yes stop_codon:yes gene_type:complete